MALMYSVAFDLDGSRDDREPKPNAKTCWDVTRQCLVKMREAENLPASDTLDNLWGDCAVKLSGRSDLDIHWACDSHDGRSEWAFHLLHPGRDEARLLWRLDISCRDIEQDHVRVGVRLDVSALDGGVRPYGFSVASPRVVPDLLSTWPAKRGGLELNRQFVHWRRLSRLRRSLSDPDRELPIVIAGPSVCGSSWPTRIAREFHGVPRSLAGTAVLAALATHQDVEKFNDGFDPALHFVSEDEFAIYWPIERGSLGTQLSERRRSIRLGSYESPKALALDLLDLVAQRGVLHDAGKVTSFKMISRRREDVERKKAKLDRVASDRQVNELVDQLVEAEERVEELDQELTEERLEKNKLNALLRSNQSRDDSANGTGLLDWRTFQKWRGVRDVLGAVKLALGWPGFVGRLVFAESVADKAAKCRYGDPGRVLEILLFAASDYLNAVRAGESGRALETLASERGFELATVERKQTRNDTRMMQKRDVVVDGRKVRCEAHFKDGKGVDDQLLRIHFAIDGEPTKQRLVIGHVGGHLETAGTRKV